MAREMSMELLEREGFLQSLTGYEAEAATGDGRVVLIAGEAGIGKTVLVRAFTESPERKGVTAWGSCDGLFTPRPLGPLFDMGPQLGGEIAAALSAGAPRDELFSVTLATLRSATDIHTLVFDDIHWADEATLDLLRVIGRRAGSLRALVIATYRDDELGPSHPLRTILGDLATSAGLRRIFLPPLSLEGVNRLVAQSSLAAQEVHELTGGNPFFVTELLGAGFAEVPQSVRDVVLARVAKLSPAAQEVIKAAALIGLAVEPDILQQITSCTDDLVEECVGSGILTSDHTGYAFRHELSRRAIEDSVTPTAALELHRSILNALEERSDTAPARLAHHAEAAARPDAVLQHAVTAAEHAAGLGAHREAAEQFARALRFGGRLTSEQRADFFERRSYECYLTDQLPEAIEARKAALDAWRAVGNRLKEGESLRWLSRLSWFLGDNEQSERMATEAVVILEPLGSTAQLAMAYSNRAHLRMLKDDLEEVREWGGRAIAIAEPLGETEIIVHALNNIGAAKFAAGDPSGRDDLEKSLTMAVAGGFEEHVARAYTNLGSVAVRQRDYTTADEYLRAGIGYSTERDLDSWRIYMTSWRIRSLFEQGLWVEAERSGVSLMGAPTAPSPVSQIQALIVVGLIRARRGQPSADRLDAALKFADSTRELQRLGPTRAARAEAAWLRGDADALRAEAAICLELAGRSYESWLVGALIYWAQRAGLDPEVPDGVPEPYARHLAGDFAAAASLWDAIGCPYEAAIDLAYTREPAAMKEGFARLEKLGAQATIDALGRDLRSQGVRGVPRGARKTTRDSPFGLTRRETEVLSLIARGLRNADIARELYLSPKTVEHHVSVVLMKLGVETRSAAAGLARDLRLIDASSATDAPT
jgi:DNA-binding CsgD family transcriptional regulator/tetratricopeptide (TPR) repeat protein